jgi:hypothetical protein
MVSSLAGYMPLYTRSCDEALAKHFTSDIFFLLLDSQIIGPATAQPATHNWITPKPMIALTGNPQLATIS